MEIEVTAGGTQMHDWFLPQPGDMYAMISLEPVLGPPDPAPGAGDGHSHGIAVARLYLARPIAGVKDYLSDLAVVDEGQQMLEQTIEVNHPLHFGGYHFYQYDYDQEGEQYTILSVTSDSGLLLVYAGFILLVAGAFFQGWLLPAWNFLARRRPDAAR
jgi:hypothetical protein